MLTLTGTTRPDLVARHLGASGKECHGVSPLEKYLVLVVQVSVLDLLSRGSSRCLKTTPGLRVRAQYNMCQITRTIIDLRQARNLHQVRVLRDPGRLGQKVTSLEHLYHPDNYRMVRLLTNYLYDYSTSKL